MQIKSYHFALMLVGLVLGTLLSIQFKSTSEANKNPQIQRVETLSYRAAQLRVTNEEKNQQLIEMRSQLDKLAKGPDINTLKESLYSAQIEAGLLEIKGPGVQVVLNDSNAVAKQGENPNLYVLHDEDILKVLNELRAAGAEALAINDERILSTSEIRCAGPTILINKSKRLTPPFIVSAIGEPDTMLSALEMRGGVVESLKFWGIQISVKKVPEITIPHNVSGVSFELAEPVGEVQ